MEHEEVVAADNGVREDGFVIVCRRPSQRSSKPLAGCLAFCQRTNAQTYHLEGKKPSGAWSTYVYTNQNANMGLGRVQRDPQLDAGLWSS